MTPALAATTPITRRVRAYFAPVNRAAAAPTIFDAAQSGTFALNSPPAPWIDLGWCSNLARKTGTKVSALQSGTPAIAQAQMRTEIDATVSLQFEAWGKLQLALAAGSQQMNLLATVAGAIANGSGGPATSATPLLQDGSSTATQLSVGEIAAAAFAIGSLVVGTTTSALMLSSVGAMLATCLCAAVGIVVVRRGMGEAAFSAVCVALIVVGGLSTLVALVQVFEPTWADSNLIAPSSVVGRATGNLRQPNHLCSLMAWAIVALVWLVEAGRLRRWLASVCGAIFLFTLVLTAYILGVKLREA